MTLIKLFCEFFLGHVNFCSGWYNSLIHLPEGQVLKKNFGKDCRRHEIHNFSAGLHEHNHAFTIQLSRTTVKVLKFDGFHYMVILAPK